MKHITTLSFTLIFSLTLLSCSSSSKEFAPSQNPTLYSITKSSAATKKEGSMQKALDSWLQNDWEPTVAKDTKIQEKYMQKEEKKSTTKSTHYVDKKNKPFTLQEYVDKASAYMQANPSDYNNSNVKKLQSLPVIGN